MAATFKFDAKDLLKGIAELDDKSEAAMEMYVDTSSKKLEEYAKENAPWTDRTGMARKTLRGTHERTAKGFKIILSYGVNYGIWLEYAHEKKWAILEPTIMAKGPSVVKGFEKLLDRIKVK